MSHTILRAPSFNFSIAVIIAGSITLGCHGPESPGRMDLAGPRHALQQGANDPLAQAVRSETAPSRAPTERRTATAKPAEPQMLSYPADRIFSPLSPAVIHRLRAVVKRVPGRSAGVFMKVGDSHLSNRMTLGCFAPGLRDRVHLGQHRDLASTLAFFSGPLSVGRTSFDRRSLAVRGAMSIAWVLRQRRARLRREIRAINPRFAVIAFGTNDMDRSYGGASTKRFERNLQQLLDYLLDQGVIPIVLGLPPRTDRRHWARFAVKYNEVTRRVAESRQVLYINQMLAVKTLPRQGLAGDGVHANHYVRGFYRTCDFSAAGLRHGSNLRNLLVLKALHQLRKALGDSNRRSQPMHATAEHPAGIYFQDRWPAGRVVLTFDDGPLHYKTDRILDLLKRSGVKATFFVVGAMIRSTTYQTIQRIVREGHILANHSYHHRIRMVWQPKAHEVILREFQLNQAIVDVALIARSPEMFRKLRRRLLGSRLGYRFPKRLLKAWPVIRDNWRDIVREHGPGGKSPYQMVYSRPPGGNPFHSRIGAKYRRIYASAMQKLGLVTVLWTSMSTDSCPWLPQKVRKNRTRVVRSIIRGTRKGGVLLMHDWMNTLHLRDALKSVVKDSALHVVSLDTLLGRKPGCMSHQRFAP